MRGKGTVRQGSNARTRITPAYAGKSWNEQAAKCAERDHPRLCGEKVPEEAEAVKIMGSPPPMRGKVEIPLYRTFQTRITPAYAGKRLQRSTGEA